jgi:hypothetical protein
MKILLPITIFTLLSLQAVFARDISYTLRKGQTFQLDHCTQGFQDAAECTKIRHSNVPERCQAQGKAAALIKSQKLCPYFIINDPESYACGCVTFAEDDDQNEEPEELDRFLKYNDGLIHPVQ